MQALKGNGTETNNAETNIHGALILKATLVAPQPADTIHKQLLLATMAHLYPYIGSEELATFTGDPPARGKIQSQEDVRQWIAAGERSLRSGSSFVLTFILDASGSLWIADRHSEHVQCARGGPVLSAGEMTFQYEKREITVAAITNQSTGYCPEPKSWIAVAPALDHARIQRPDYWTHAFEFRRCPSCGNINIIKEDWFSCGVCEAALTLEYNLL
jgi:hypothetical protein